jgi:hypothetical protein
VPEVASEFHRWDDNWATNALDREPKVVDQFLDELIHFPRTIGRLLRWPFIRIAFHKNGRPRGWLRRLRSLSPVPMEVYGNIASAPHLQEQTEPGRPPPTEGFDIRLAESSLADLEPAYSEPREPDITPLPIYLRGRGSAGEAIFRAAAALATIPWVQRPEPTRRAHRAKERYAAAKLKTIHSGGGELAAEFRAAMSVWASGATAGASAEGLVGAAGIIPSFEPVPAQQEPFDADSAPLPGGADCHEPEVASGSR